MKKFFVKSKTFLIFLSLALTFGCCLLLTGCGSKKYELVSAVVAESEYDRDYIFINNEAADDILVNPERLRFILALTLKDAKGVETTAELDLNWDYDLAGGGTLKAWVKIDDGTGNADAFVDMEASGYDDSTVGDKKLTLKLGGNSESVISSGECSLEIPYTVFHALKSCEIKDGRKENYNIGEELELDMVLTYEDDTTQEVSFAELMDMRAYNEDTSVSGFDSSVAGMSKPLRIAYNTSAGGHRSEVIYYNVLPDASVWEKVEASSPYTFNYYKTAAMTETTENKRNIPYKTVSFGDAKVYMTLANGVAVRPSVETFQNGMNSTSNNDRLLHSLVPDGQTATVSDVKNAGKYYKVDYTLSGSPDKQNEMYLLVQTGASNRMILLFTEDIGSLSESDRALTEQFIELVWFR